MIKFSITLYVREWKYIFHKKIHLLTRPWPVSSPVYTTSRGKVYQFRSISIISTASINLMTTNLILLILVLSMSSTMKNAFFSLISIDSYCLVFGFLLCIRVIFLSISILISCSINIWCSRLLIRVLTIFADIIFYLFSFYESSIELSVPCK